MTFQQRFAQSDDAAQMMTRVREVVRVDASGASLGALVELLMLRRSTDRCCRLDTTRAAAASAIGFIPTVRERRILWGDPPTRWW